MIVCFNVNKCNFKFLEWRFKNVVTFGLDACYVIKQKLIYKQKLIKK